MLLDVEITLKKKLAEKDLRHKGLRENLWIFWVQGHILGK